jgi:F-type H+-transporting ATPase subunit a
MIISKRKLKKFIGTALVFLGVGTLASFTIANVDGDHTDEVATEEVAHGLSEDASDAHGEGAHGAEPEFNAGDIILHHVKDAHELHLFTAHVPLPIIILDGGLKVFSSSHFYHAPEKHQTIGEHEYHYQAYDGFALVHEKIYKTDEAGNLLSEKDPETGEDHIAGKAMDFSITKNVAGILTGVLLLLLIFLGIAKKYKRNPDKAPKGLQSWMEPLIMFIRDDVAKPAIGAKYERYMPYLLSLFFFILIGNMMGLIPFLGGMNWTGNIAVTAVLAMFTFLIMIVSGNKAFWMHIIWPPGIPMALKPMLILIELFGTIMKPVVLCLRLFANITAGHIIILSFTCLIFIFNYKMGTGAAWGTSVASVLFSVFMNFLELLVAFLQAYVFLLLSSLYFGSAVEEAAH